MKLKKSIEGKVKRKEPGIQALARNYNKLCQELKQLILSKKCPLGAISPVLIDLEGLFLLDVDDNIWQDIGLTDENDNSIDIPPWLINDNVRAGIRALLDYNRCEEEEKRLKQERISLQQWFTEEWFVLDAAISWSQDDPEVLYQLLERQKYLLKLCIIWQPCLRKHSFL